MVFLEQFPALKSTFLAQIGSCASGGPGAIVARQELPLGTTFTVFCVRKTLFARQRSVKPLAMLFVKSI